MASPTRAFLAWCVGEVAVTCDVNVRMRIITEGVDIAVGSERMRLCKMAAKERESGFTTDELLRHYASIEAQGELVLSDRQQVCHDLVG